MKSVRLLAVFAAIQLPGCEPLRGVVSEKDTGATIDISCADEALRSAFGKIQRWDYVDDGSGSFPNGTEVAQFAYYQPKDGAGWATLHVGRVGDKTRMTHSFTGVGAELRQDTFPPAKMAMEKATRVLKAECGADLSGMKLKAVGQKVDGF